MSITISNATGLVSFFDAKGATQELTAEGALFKGGKALASLKGEALNSALQKAANGKFRAASEVLATAFPSRHKAWTNLYSALPWANKVEMASYILAIEGAVPGKSGEWTTKQASARLLLAELKNLPAFKREPSTVATFEMAVSA